MGVLAVDANKWFPESVEVVPNYPLPSRGKGQQPITLTNYPIVDKNVLFTHGLAALQELFLLYDDQIREIDRLRQLLTSSTAQYSTLHNQLEKAASERLQEKRAELAKELELRETQLSLDALKLGQEKARVDQEMEAERSLLQYEQELTRSRMSMQEQLSKDIAAASLAQEKQLAEAREVRRKEGVLAIESKKIELNRDLEQRKAQLEVDKIRAELGAKADAERANEDVNIRKMQAQAQLDTQRMVEGIRTVSQQVVVIVQEFLSRPQQIAAVLGAIVAVFASYHVFCQVVVLLREWVRSRLGRPSLVRETSYSWSVLPNWLHSLLSGGGKVSPGGGYREIDKYFSQVILDDEDRERVLQLAQSTRNTRATGAPYRHVLLHGPPGTGKTLIGT